MHGPPKSLHIHTCSMHGPLRSLHIHMYSCMLSVFSTRWYTIMTCHPFLAECCNAYRYCLFLCYLFLACFLLVLYTVVLDEFAQLVQVAPTICQCHFSYIENRQLPQHHCTAVITRQGLNMAPQHQIFILLISSWSKPP